MDTRHYREKVYGLPSVSRIVICIILKIVVRNSASQTPLQEVAVLVKAVLLVFYYYYFTISYFISQTMYFYLMIDNDNDTKSNTIYIY